ncbi:hypothetical protein FB645_000685 [Coemansia sp. IMI 203386]|nr:hypothetical protein FB645_000685 [Coemansia sp. IMI 203386]
MLSANSIAHPAAHLPLVTNTSKNSKVASSFTALETAANPSSFGASNPHSAAFSLSDIGSSGPAAAAAASAFALAASTAMTASTSSAVAATAALAAAAMAAASNNGANSAFCGAPFALPKPGMPLMHTMQSTTTAAGNTAIMNSISNSSSSSSANNTTGALGNNGYIDSRNMGASSGPLAAPRPVNAQQMAPPSWMLAALPLEMLLGLTAPNYKQKIINDVFFTPEERCDSPRLTPVSDIDDTRQRPLVPGSEMESLDPSADLALFADDAQSVVTREVWAAADEIETTSVCSNSTRQSSPAPTMTSEAAADDDLLLLPPDTALCGGSAVSNKCHHSPLSAHVAQSKSQYSSCADSDTASLSGESCVDSSDPAPAMVRESLRPTIFEELSHNGVDWCRYCGTTEGINWRPGPWGKRTLCNKHGCDYKGYGFASKMPRLNLKNFADEMLEERIRPVLQTFCQMCQQDFSECENVLIHCDGCHRAYHQNCHPEGIADSDVRFDARWYCEPSCRDNARKRRIVVELPKCRLPYMCSPRHNAAAAAAAAQNGAGQESGTAATRNTRSRKRKPSSASSDSAAHPEPAAQRQRQNASASSTQLSKTTGASGRVRKSSRVTRPSLKRLASDYTA